jgi:DNA polymerase-4
MVNFLAIILMSDIQKTILHLDLDSFFVSVERLKNPALVGKPVIVGGTENRGVVSSCSYEARKYGVRSAMPTAQAKRLCPDAVFIHSGYGDYSKYSAIVTQIIAASSPEFYKASIDEFYIDISGMDKFFGCEKWSHELRNKIISETGLPISWGMASTKMIAKMCTQDAKPNGTFVVPHGKEQEYLDPKFVGEIPFVGAKMAESLNKMGIYTIAQLRMYELDFLIKRFGKSGLFLWRKARGIEQTEVAAHSIEKSISMERTFSENKSDEVEIKSLLFKLTEKLAFDLRQSEKQTSCITIKIRYPDFETYTHQRHIFPEYATPDLYSIAECILDEIWNDRMPLRQIGIKFSQLSQLNHQLSVFDANTKKTNRYKIIDQLKIKHGKNKIMFGGNL